MQTVPSDCEAWYRSKAGSETAGWRIWWNVPDMKSATARSACLACVTVHPDWTFADIEGTAPKSTRLDELQPVSQ